MPLSMMFSVAILIVVYAGAVISAEVCANKQGDDCCKSMFPTTNDCLHGIYKDLASDICMSHCNMCPSVVTEPPPTSTTPTPTTPSDQLNERLTKCKLAIENGVEGDRNAIILLLRGVCDSVQGVPASCKVAITNVIQGNANEATATLDCCMAGMEYSLRNIVAGKLNTIAIDVDIC